MESAEGHTGVGGLFADANIWISHHIQHRVIVGDAAAHSGENNNHSQEANHTNNCKREQFHITHSKREQLQIILSG